ncbi:uncharacterized protein LOC143882482 [Tasmannia lanceolata]|uniref:uncharacterized protein LOC143882482 n=1 Tax=Tasmannia lanceolata TaxID=3420 RepID=UPI004063DA70
MAFPYVSAADEKERMENFIISRFIENCGHQLEMNCVVLMDSCTLEGEDLQKLAGLDAFHEYVGSEDAEKAEETNKFRYSGASHTILYASYPSRAIRYSSHHAMGRFLDKGTLGNGSANSTSCGVFQTKSSLMEGVFIGVVLLLISLSGLCCMMAIDSPTTSVL